MNLSQMNEKDTVVIADDSASFFVAVLPKGAVVAISVGIWTLNVCLSEVVSPNTPEDAFVNFVDWEVVDLIVEKPSVLAAEDDIPFIEFECKESVGFSDEPYIVVSSLCDPMLVVSIIAYDVELSLAKLFVVVSDACDVSMT